MGLLHFYFSILCDSPLPLFHQFFCIIIFHTLCELCKNILRLFDFQVAAGGGDADFAIRRAKAVEMILLLLGALGDKSTAGGIKADGATLCRES